MISYPVAALLCCVAFLVGLGMGIYKVWVSENEILDDRSADNDR